MAANAENRTSPKVLAMVICDMVIRDELTRNVSLVGLFNAVAGKQLPLQHDRMHVFISLTDGHGEKPFLLQCKSPDDSEVFRVEGKVRFEDPLAVADLNIALRSLVFQQSGDHLLDFFCGGELLITRRFSVIVQDGAS